MTEYTYYQSIVQYKVPIDEEGVPGTPVVIKAFTTPLKRGTGTNKQAKKQPKKLTSSSAGEIEL